MMKAYILVNTELGYEEPVAEALQDVKEITGVHKVYGIYDLVIEMEAESVDDVKEIVFDKVRRLRYVKSTVTLLTYGEPVRNE